MSLQVWLPLNGDLHNQGLSSTTFTGTAAYKSYGKLGKQSLNLQNRITCSTPSLNGLQFFSVAFWARIEPNPDSTANWMDVIGFTDQKSDNSANGQFRFETGYGSDSQGGIHWHDNTTNAIINGSNTYNTAAQRNEWHHIVVTVADDSIKSYYDGTLQRTHTTNLNKGHLTGSWWLGESTTRGCIQDVRIYDHPLSAKEVEEIAKGLVLHYKLDNNGMGGENLALNTKNLNIASSKDNLYMAIRGGTLQVRDDGFTEVKCTSSFQGLSFYANQLNLAIGTKITYSFYIYCNGSRRAFSFYPMMYNSAGTRDISTGLPISLDGGSYTTVNSKSFTSTSSLVPERHYVTFEWNQAVADIISNGGRIELSIQIHGLWNSGDWGCLFAPKVEIGDKPTVWSPEKSELGNMATIMYDSSGYSNNGTIVGSLTAVEPSPRYDVATQFNGTSSYIEAEPLPSETVTISAWVKFKTLPGGYKIILHDKFTGLAIGLTSTYRLITYVGSTNGGIGSQAQLPTLSTDTWYHIVVIKTGNTTRDVYFNGEQITNLSQNYWGGDLDKFTIGARHISGAYSNFFDGQISDVRVYTTALNSIQIKELYNTSMSIDSNGNVYARELREL